MDEERKKIKKIKEKIERKKKKKPYFFPQNLGRKKRIKERWRRPRGIDSKKRIEISYLGPVPKIGYRTEKSIRGLHPSGRKEILICSKKELLEKINEIKEKNLLVRLSSTLGKKSREEIKAIAENEKIKILNVKP
jgi:large subunit ribosomal protein L32e